MYRSIAAIVLAVCCLVLPTSSNAQIHKCVNAAGKVEFTNMPCSAGTTGGPIDVKPNVLDTSGAREQALQEENRRLREEMAETRQRELDAARAPQRTQADLQAERADSFECQKAKRNLDVAVNAGRKGRDTTPEELAIYSACGLRVPDKTVIQLAPQATLRIRSCDPGGCWDNQGNRYSGNLNSGFLRGPNGTCRVSGPYLRC